MNVTLEKLDNAIKGFYEASSKIISSAELSSPTVLQKANACLCIISSNISTPTRLDEISTDQSNSIRNCENFDELLKSVPPFLIRLISDFPLLTNSDEEYWYEQTIQSVYLCLRSLRVKKLLQINLEYFHDLLKCTSDCLAKICRSSRKSMVILLFLRIVYACLAGLPISTIGPTACAVMRTLFSYFDHENINVQLSARNAAQFFIPTLVDESDRRRFLLNSKNICDCLSASGKDMPISSSLKLLYSFAQLPQNCDSLLRNGVHLYSAAIMFKSGRETERNIAFSLLKLLLLHKNRGTTISEDDKTIVKDAEIKHTEMCKTVDASTSLSNILLQLSNQSHHFKTSCLQNDARSGKSVFECLEHILKQLEDCIHSNKHPPDEIHITESKHVCALMNITAEFIESLTITDEYQLMRWGCKVLFDSWNLLKLVHKQTKCLLGPEVISTLIDKNLVGIATFVQKKKSNEVSVKSILLFLDILVDILYEMKTDQNALPLAAIKKCLLDLRILKYHSSLTLQCQVIISFLVSESDSELHTELCVEKKAIVRFINKLKECDNLETLLQGLQKMKALTKIPGNRVLMRQCDFLEFLESISEEHADSTVESVSAELICILLSDPPDEFEDKQSPLHNFERFMTACFEDTVGIKDFDLVDIKQLIALSGAPDTDSSHDIPHVIVQHATFLYQVMSASYNEFHRVLYSSKAIDVAYLVTVAKSLKELCSIYEDENESERNIAAFEKQVIYVSKKFLPEFVCISFKAMKDAHSDILSDLDREVYFNSLMPYLCYLNFAIERWSRMDQPVKTVLLNYGGFHLLLNEIHTASTTKIINSDIVYDALTSLYNVLLDPSLAKYFRICITKKLLTGSTMQQDVGIHCLSNFCFSCLHMILSKSELSEVSLSQHGVDMLARCVNGVDKFFGGDRNLIKTVSNLARNPSNWQKFISAGIVSTLKALALNPTVSNEVFFAMLNMIPEPSISNLLESNEDIDLPLTNAVTVLLTSDLMFMKHIQSSDEQVCKGLVLLLSPHLPETIGLDYIHLLYKLQRYSDCFLFCKHLLINSVSGDHFKKAEIQLYQAKCVFHVYHHEILEKMELSNVIPGFKYMETMRKFCKKWILRVVNMLTKVKELIALEHSGSAFSQEKLNERELVYMLDKSLLDCLVFNTKSVTTCLLCHSRTQKLIHSHYIPKSILAEFVKAMGLDPGATAFIFSPTDHPSDWHFRSVGKFTFSMLCKTCDGEVLSKDENTFKSNFFNKIYEGKSSGSLLLEHSISYSQYLYKFAAGLLFRNIAPLYSSICAAVGNFMDLHHLMHSFREVIFNKSASMPLPKVYLLFLPTKLPSVYPQVSGWDRFAFMINSPYGAFKLLQPGGTMVPNRLYCFMVKIGIMVFITPIDDELRVELEKLCPFAEIKFADEDKHELFVPNDEERCKYIPEKLWWSFLGWAKKETNSAFSVAMSVKPPTHLSSRFPPGLLVKQVLESSEANIQPVTSNLLPPGFEVNFENPNTLPEKVVVVPHNGTVLLHSDFKTSSDAQGYVAIIKLDHSASKESCHDQNIYSVIKQPCILVYLEDKEKKVILKAGFVLDESSLRIKDDLPGVPTSMKDSPGLQELAKSIPHIADFLLRRKGFRSLKSLLFWYEDGNAMNTLALDTRCTGKGCIYCNMRCDACLQPCLDRYKVINCPGLGEVQCCSEECSNSLFPGAKDGVISFRTEDIAYKEKTQLLSGFFTIDDECYSGLKTAVQFSVFKTEQSITGLYSIPPESMYVKFWFRSIHKPLFIEYRIDDDFTAIEPLTCESSHKVFSSGEEREIMTQLHEILVKIGIPYHLMIHQIANPA